MLYSFLPHEIYGIFFAKIFISVKKIINSLFSFKLCCICYYFLIPPLKKAVSDSRPWFWQNWWYAWQCNKQLVGCFRKRLFYLEHVQVLVKFYPVQVDPMKKIHSLKCFFFGCFFSPLTFIIWLNQTKSINSLAIRAPQVQRTK